MQFEFTEEQRMITDMVGDFCAAEGSGEKVRLAMASDEGYLPETWRTMVTELGLNSLLVPESAGGQGLSMVEAALVFQAIGRHLLPSPLLSTSVVATGILSALGATDLLSRIAQGEITASAARLQDSSAGFMLDGHADLLLLLNQDSGELFAVEQGHPCLEVKRVNTLDQTRRFFNLLVSGDLADCRLSADEDAVRAFDAGMDLGRIAVAAEAAGAAETCLERTVAYSQERVQFGRAIGSFQAVKHQMADMMIEIEAAISAVYFAACAVSEGHEESPQLAAMAKVQASEALSFCAGRMIQLHGGIGFTWEHDAHLYFKRARSTVNLFGSNTELDENIASLIGLGNCA